MPFHLKTPFRSAAALGAMMFLAACSGNGLNLAQEQVHGFVASENIINQIGEGSSREEVLLVYGTPSVTRVYGDEVFYYISQLRRKNVAFAQMRVVEQSVVAVYFDNQGLVTRVANYGLKDGKVFDFVSRTTPTQGKDFSFIEQVIRGAVSGALAP